MGFFDILKPDEKIYKKEESVTEFILKDKFTYPGYRGTGIFYFIDKDDNYYRVDDDYPSNIYVWQTVKNGDKIKLITIHWPDSSVKRRKFEIM